MRRFQLFEFLDQAWLPEPIRKAGTRYLEAAHGLSAFPAVWANTMAKVLPERELKQIVDLGSGSGGPVKAVLEQLSKLGHSPRVTLTDLFPVESAAGLDYWPDPVHAQSVPVELKGTRTLFLTFHHFTPSCARAVLKDAFEKRQSICIFEATARTPMAILTAFLVPLLVLLFTPSIRPVSKFQIVFTYIIPLMPLLFFWDGMVSQFRSYSVAELLELSGGMTSEEYGWECGSIQARKVPFKTCYLIGCPKSL